MTMLDGTRRDYHHDEADLCFYVECRSLLTHPIEPIMSFASLRELSSAERARAPARAVFIVEFEWSQGGRFFGSSCDD